MEALNPKAGALPLATSILGKKRWEIGVEIEGGWRTHRAVLAAREPFRDVLMWRTVEGGSRRFISVSGEPVFDRSGRFAGYRGIGRDVSAQQRAERALRLSEARFRSLTNLSSDWFWEQDAQYRFTRIEGRRVAGGDNSLRERLIGARRWETSLQVEGGWEAHRAVLEARKPFCNVLMWRTMPDGKVRYLRVSGEPAFADDGSFAGYRGVGSDVTAQKRNEQLLRLEHEVARSLSEADSAADGVKAVLRAVCEAEGWGCGRCFRLDEAAGVLRFEDGWCLPEPMYERFLEASRPLVFRSGQGLSGIVWQSGEPVWSSDTSRDARVLGKALAQDSSIRGAFAFGVVAEGRTIGVLGFSSHAVREPDQRLLQATRVIGSQVGQFLRRKQTEAILRASEERFRRTFQIAGSGVAQISLDGRHQRVNRRYCEILGRCEGELIGRSVKEISHPEDRDVTDAQRARMHAGQIDTAHFERRYLREDGSAVWVALNVALERDAAGNPLYEISVIDDITATKQMEAALRESEERFRSLTELSSDFYWEQDEQFRFVERNLTEYEKRRYPAGADPADAVIGKARWELPALNFTDADWTKHRADLEAHREFRNLEIERPLPSGERRWISTSGRPIFDADGRFRGYRGVGTDITERKRAAQLLALEHSVTRRFAETPDAVQALKGAIQAICESEQWGCGRYLWVDAGAGLLRFGEAWSVPEANIERYIEESRDMVYAPGAGLAGTVWQSQQPLWVPDITNDPRVARPALAQAMGMRATLAVPVLAEGKAIGVLIFHSRRVREPDERLLQAIRVVGAQIGQFVQRAHAEQALRESEERFRSLTQLSSDFFWESDERHKLSQLVHGPGYQRGVGHSEIGKATWEIPSVNPDEAGWAAHREKFEQRLPFRDFEFARATPDGVIRHFSVSGEPRFGADGRFLGYRGVGRDVTEIALAREHVASLAYHDPLTGLANRTSLGPALELAVQRARRKHAKVAVVFIDLDGFKQVNDLYGHDAGDALLIEVANRLRANLRASDLMARLGGDEFVVVLEEVQDLAPVETVARKLNADLARSYAVAGNEAVLTASIGVSVYPDDASDAPTLMKHADVAMYAAKQAGKNAFSFYAAGPAANDPARAAERAPGRGG